MRRGLLPNCVVVALLVAAATSGANELREELTRHGAEAPFIVALGGEVAFADESLRPRGAGSPGLGLRGFFGTTYDVGVPLVVGLEIGVTTWNVNHGEQWSNTHTVGMGVLPTCFYEFPRARFLGASPYVGLSLGPFLSWNRTDGRSPRTTSNFAVGVEALARPGLSFRLGHELALNVEAAFGVAAGALVLAPQLKLTLPLWPGRNQIHADEG